MSSISDSRKISLILSSFGYGVWLSSLFTWITTAMHPSNTSKPYHPKLLQEYLIGGAPNLQADLRLACNLELHMGISNKINTLQWMRTLILLPKFLQNRHYECLIVFVFSLFLLAWSLVICKPVRWNKDFAVLAGFLLRSDASATHHIRQEVIAIREKMVCCDCTERSYWSLRLTRQVSQPLQ